MSDVNNVGRGKDEGKVRGTVRGGGYCGAWKAGSNTNRQEKQRRVVGRQAIATRRRYLPELIERCLRGWVLSRGKGCSPPRPVICKR